jgi:hypothetical protein
VSVIVAGDGNAYATYLNEDLGSPSGYVGTFTRTRHWMLLRLSPDGSYQNTELLPAPTETTNCYVIDANAEPSPLVQCNSNAPIFYINQSYVITNGDQGVVAFGNGFSNDCAATEANEGLPPNEQNGCPTSSDLSTKVQIAVVSNGSVTVNVTDALVFQYPNDASGFKPGLQLADGSIVGVEVNYAANNSLQDSVIDISLQGSEQWSQTLGPAADGSNTPVTPLYASDDGSVTITSSNYNSGSLGTISVIDQNGNLLSQTPDSGARYTWSANWYSDAGGTLSEISGPVIRPPLSYAGYAGGNPAGNGRSIGVSESQGALPVFAVPSWGVSCKLAKEGIGTKVPLEGQPLERYNNLRAAETDGNCLPCSSCASFFNSIPALAAIFNQLTAGISNQVPYDGLQSNISQYDAGMIKPAELGDPSMIRQLKGAPVCGLFMSYQGSAGFSPTLQPATAASQIVSDQGGQGTDIYINTKKLKSLTQGTILHEVLHQLTQLYDEDLMSLFGLTKTQCGNGTACITTKLVNEGCAPN